MGSFLTASCVDADIRIRHFFLNQLLNNFQMKTVSLKMEWEGEAKEVALGTLCSLVSYTKFNSKTSTSTGGRRW